MKTWGLDCNGPDKHSCTGCSHYKNERCQEMQNKSTRATRIVAGFLSSYVRIMLVIRMVFTIRDMRI